MLEYAVKALDAATDKASINSAVAKTTAEEVVGKEAQLEVAKDAALGRLEDYAEVKALANFTRSEKAAYNQALADEKAAIDAAANIDAVNTALKKAKEMLEKSRSCRKNRVRMVDSFGKD